MGALAAGGMGSQLGIKSPADTYIGLLKSRTITDDIINQFHLGAVYRTKLMSSTRKALSRHASFSTSKESLISISIDDKDARQAAAMANAYVDALYKQNSRLALTEASQRRVFFEQQLANEKDALANAEVELKRLQQSTGLVVPEGQAQVLIHSSAQLRAEIASRRVELQAMRAYATEENPQMQVVKREISALETQLNQVEASSGSSSRLEVSGARLPEVSLEYVRRLRNLKYHETLFELLAKQYEVARIDEAKQAPIIQIVDRAVIPDRDSRHRGALVSVAALLGFIISSLFILLCAPATQTVRQIIEHQSRLASNRVTRSLGNPGCDNTRSV
jgi:uncharacterized protein involved in exopolysaccharide biosynthesis